MVESVLYKCIELAIYIIHGLLTTFSLGSFFNNRTPKNLFKKNSNNNNKKYYAVAMPAKRDKFFH